MAKKSCRKANSRNVRSQKNAEKKQRKINRLAKNAKKAREAKRDLSGLNDYTLKTSYMSDDKSFDPKTHHPVLFVIKTGDDLRVLSNIHPNDSTQAELMNQAAGMACMSYGSGAVVIDFPPTWSMERVLDKIHTDAWLATIEEEIDRNDSYVMYARGDIFDDFINETVSEFSEWIADCGESPDEHGMIDVDVSSSAINHVRYDINDHTMRITFNSGSVYDYSGVPRKRFTGLVSANSVGSYFWHNIRDEYDYQHVA